MKFRSLHGIGLMLVASAAIASGCTGSNEVPDGAICVVNGEEIPIKGEVRSFEQYIDNTLAAYKAQKQPVPKEGSQPRTVLEQNAVDALIRQELFEQEAEDRDVEVTDKEVDDRVKELKENFFTDGEEEFKKELEKSGLTEDSLRDNVRQQILREKLFEEVTKDVDVSKDDVREYFDENKDQYAQKASRTVAHILVDGEAEAKRLRAEAADASDEEFGELAKEHSKDPGSAESGGELQVRRGETVPEFDKVAFELEVGEVSQPVKTQFGWHIITARSEVTPASDAKFEDNEQQIKAQLEQQEKSELMTDWESDVIADAKDDVNCAEGYTWTQTVTETNTAPPSDNVEPAGTTEATTEDDAGAGGGEDAAGESEGDGGNGAGGEDAEAPAEDGGDEG